MVYSNGKSFIADFMSNNIVFVIILLVKCIYQNFYQIFINIKVSKFYELKHLI